MRALFLAMVLLVGAPAHAQLMTLGVGGGNGSGYLGPGDLVSGAAAWYGLRAYSGAQARAGAKAITVCAHTDALCASAEDETVNPDGTLHLGTIAAACTYPSNTCLVGKFYDQSGHGLDVNRVTNPGATFHPGCIGSLPCVFFQSTNTNCYQNTSATVNAQPITISWVAERTANFTSQMATLSTQITGGNQPADYFANLTNTGWMFAGTAVRAYTLADSTFHAEQSVYNNSTTPGAIIDGTATTLAGSPGSTAPGARLQVGCTNGGGGNGTYLDGQITEVGYWPVAFSAGQGATMNTNQRKYWGY